MVRWPWQRLIRAGGAPCHEQAHLGHRLEARAPFSELSRPGPLRTSRRHAAPGEPPPGEARRDTVHRGADWPDDLCEIIYIDHYGNAMSGMRALMLPRDARLVVGGRLLESAGTFSDRPPGTAFWYDNSNGLVEIAVNQGRADRELNLAIGSPVEIVE